MLFDQGLDIPEALVSDALTVELMAERVRYNLRIKAKDAAAAKKAGGLKLPSKIGMSSKSGDRLILKLGPDEWVLSDSPKKTAELSKTMAKLSDGFIMSATEISHRNIGFILSGPKASRAVNVGCPLDLSLDKFPVGKATRTIFENAPVQLYRAGEHEFHIECWRSFAPYLRDFLAISAKDL